MSRIGKIARRTFLIGSVAVVGGVAFGAYQVKKDAPNPLTAGDGEAVLNPFVIVDRQGVTIIAPRAEMGQGIHTTLAALVAEELDVAWEDIRVIHGPPAQAYANQALLGLALPFKHYEDGEWRHWMREQIGEAGKLLSLQVTGGSTSTKDMFTRMRVAGASAREALKMAAAQRFDADAADMRTENGVITAPNGETVTYAEIASEAVGIDPGHVAPRPASTWKYLGKSMPRVDGVAKSTGTAIYAGDVQLPGLLFATAIANPKRQGHRSFDASAAEAMEGVQKVVDLGESGIGVIASNTWLAFEAAKAIEVDWEQSDYPATSAEMDSIIRASFDGKADASPRDDGDVNNAIEGTEVTVEYSVPFLAHATMEPMVATAVLQDGKLEIWSATQAPIIVRDKCAEVLGLTPEDVTVHTPLLGGGFGRRGEWDWSVQAAKIAASVPGTPVRMTWSREEDMRQDFYRPAAVARFRGVVQDGQAALVDGHIAAPSVTRISMQRVAGQTPPGPDRGHLEGAFDQPYAIPNYKITGYLSPLTVPLGFWRSVGSSFNGFFFDSFVDEMAHAAGADPLAFRLDLAQREQESSARVIERVGEMANWTGDTPDGVGRGVAFTYSFGTPVAEICEVVQEDRGIRIARMWIACDMGTVLDPSIVYSQMTSAAVYGLSAAVQGRITFAGGAAEQWNYPDYDALRMHNTPAFEVDVMALGGHMGGAGEPGTPPSASALANALFDLTGERARNLPLIDYFDLLV